MTYYYASIAFINILIIIFRKFINKELLRNIDKFTLFFVGEIVYAIAALIFYLNKKVNVKSIIGLNNNNKLLLGISPILGTVSFLLYYTLLEKFEVSKISPILSGSRNVILLIIGIVIFGETCDIKKVIGIILMTMGITLVSLSAQKINK